MITKEKVDKWLELGKNGENYNVDKSLNLTLEILNAKVLIERWDGQYSTAIILNSSHRRNFKNMLLDKVKTEYFEHKIDGDYLFNAKIHYLDDMPINKGMILNLEDDELICQFEEKSRAIALFDMIDANDNCNL